MATTLRCTAYGQKLTRVSINTEVAFTVDASALPNATVTLQIVPSSASFYHSAAGLAASDGLPIQASQTFAVRLATDKVFYMQGDGASVDIVVLGP